MFPPFFCFKLSLFWHPPQSCGTIVWNFTLNFPQQLINLCFCLCECWLSTRIVSSNYPQMLGRCEPFAVTVTLPVPRLCDQELNFGGLTDILCVYKGNTACVCCCSARDGLSGGYMWVSRAEVLYFIRRHLFFTHVMWLESNSVFDNLTQEKHLLY